MSEDKDKAMLNRYLNTEDGNEIYAFILASGEGVNINVIKLFLERGVDVNAKGHNGWTALIGASYGDGHTEIVKFLLEKGADVNAKDDDGKTPLTNALESGSKIEIVKLLLEGGADVNAKDNDGKTPLTYALEGGKIEIVKFLLEKGADVNAEDYADTAFIEASVYGHTEIVKFLLEKGADVNAKDNDNNGKTSLTYASINGHTETVKLLLEKGADVNAEDDDGKTPLTNALESGSKIEIVKLLLEGGADVNAEDYNGETPLMSASINGHTEIVKLLIEGGADVNAEDYNGETPLMFASLYGHTEIIKLLLEGGVDVNAKGHNGETPLMSASRGGHTEIVKLLIEGGADVNAKDNNGKTPLTYAFEYDHTKIVKLLLEKGADVNAKNHEYYNSIIKDKTAYLIMGHGSEISKSKTKNIVPPGCTLVVEVHPGEVNYATLNKIIYYPNKSIFLDPINNYKEIVKALSNTQGSLAIYKEGDEYPDFQYRLLSDWTYNGSNGHTPTTVKLRDSGIIQYPFKSKKPNHIVPLYEIYDINSPCLDIFPDKFRNSIFPTKESVKNNIVSMKLNTLNDCIKSYELYIKSLIITQSELFRRLTPGVFYNFLCRATSPTIRGPGTVYIKDRVPQPGQIIKNNARLPIKTRKNKNQYFIPEIMGYISEAELQRKPYIHKMGYNMATPLENKTLNNYTWEKQQNKWRKVTTKNRNNKAPLPEPLSNNQVKGPREDITNSIHDVSNNKERLSHPLNESKTGGTRKRRTRRCRKNRKTRSRRL